MDVALSTLRLVSSGGLAFLSVFAVFRVPHGVLWKPAVGATAFSWWLACIALGLLLTSPVGRFGAANAVLATLAFALFLSPWIRGSQHAATVATQVSGFTDAIPADLPGAPAQRHPLAFGQRGGPGTGGVVVTRHSGPRGLSIDLYRREDADGPQPWVVSVHGGSWSKGDNSQLPEVNRAMAARGFTVAAVSYRLAPDHSWPAQSDDVVAQIHWLREHATDLGLDSGRTVLFGRSAGGHLALHAATRADAGPLRGVIALYAPTDLVWSWNHPTPDRILDTPGTLSDLLGGALDERRTTYEAASPLQQATAAMPPTLLLHGGRDELVYPEQGQRMKDRLDELGVRCLFVELPWATHGFDANLGGPGGQLGWYAIERFLAGV